MGLTDKHLVYGDDIPADINSYRRGNSEGYTEGYNKGYSDAQKKYERPKGEWLLVGHDDTVNFYRCSICGYEEHDNFTKHYYFCPHCGAEMLEAVTNEYNKNNSN